jgi:isopenicillin N synthase-like dioxygenase
MTDFKLPLVDIGECIHGQPTERLRASKELVESFENHGFVRLKNHGVSKEFIEEIWKWVCNFAQDFYLAWTLMIELN